MNNNGDLTFRSAYGSTSTQFPISNIPMIAPFFDDVDTRGTGNVWYRISNDTSLLTKAMQDIPNFSPLWLFIATWDHVGYYDIRIDKVSAT